MPDKKPTPNPEVKANNSLRTQAEVKTVELTTVPATSDEKKAQEPVTLLARAREDLQAIKRLHERSIYWQYKNTKKRRQAAIDRLEHHIREAKTTECEDRLQQFYLDTQGLVSAAYHPTDKYTPIFTKTLQDIEANLVTVRLAETATLFNENVKLNQTIAKKDEKITKLQKRVITLKGKNSSLKVIIRNQQRILNEARTTNRQLSDNNKHLIAVQQDTRNSAMVLYSALSAQGVRLPALETILGKDNTQPPAGEERVAEDQPITRSQSTRSFFSQTP